MWSGSSVCGKNVRSGSGKIGRKTGFAGNGHSPDGRQLEPRDSVHAGLDGRRDLAKRLGLRRILLADHDRHAGVAALPGLHLERDLSEERNAELLRDASTATLAEDGVPFT